VVEHRDRDARADRVADSGDFDEGRLHAARLPCPAPHVNRSASGRLRPGSPADRRRAGDSASVAVARKEPISRSHRGPAAGGSATETLTSRRPSLSGSNLATADAAQAACQRLPDASASSSGYSQAASALVSPARCAGRSAHWNRRPRTVGWPPPDGLKVIGQWTPSVKAAQ
jgi:hypothetical protein